MAIPATLFGAVAKATDWEATDFGREIQADEYGLVLPLCLQYLTPQVRVSIYTTVVQSVPKWKA